MAAQHLMGSDAKLQALTGARLIEALESLPDWPWTGQAASIAMFGDGISNLNWRLTTNDGADVFVKVPGEGAEDFVDRALTHAANVKAAAADVAPAVLYYDEGSGVEVFEFLTGYRGLSHAEISSSTASFGMVDVYKRLHAQTPFGVTRTVQDDIDDSMRVIREHGFEIPSWCEPIVGAWDQAWRAIAAAGYDLMPSHNDPNFTNMMYAEGRPLRLVDYEFCSDNDPAYDVGTFLGIFSIDDGRRYELLEQYFGRYDVAMDARCHLLTTGMYVRYGLWCLAQANLRDADFDYEKYGLGYFVDARAIQSDPRWEFWISTQ